MNYQKVYMNQIYSSSLVGQVAHMWRNQILCDAVIKTGNINTKAHRLVLIAACPMLQHMENAAVGSHLEVRLSADIKQCSVTTFLQYLYEGFMMLTEDNCRDVEKIGKLLHVDSVVKCCVDFYKCLNTKTGGGAGTEGSKFDNQDQLEFRYVRATDLQKTLQESALKRSSSDNIRPVSPQSKRQRVNRPSSPPLSYQRSTPQRTDDRFSMAHSYSSPQDPFERVPRLGSGMTPGRPPPQTGVIEIIEDSVEVINTEPREKDSEGWPKQSDLPPIQRSMSVSVSSQLSNEPDVQIVNVSSASSHHSAKAMSTPSSRHSSDSAMRQVSEPSVEIATARIHEPAQTRPPELIQASERHTSNVFRGSEPPSFSGNNKHIDSSHHSEQIYDSSHKDETDIPASRQQSQSMPTKHTTQNLSNIPIQRPVHSQPSSRSSMPAPQSKPFAAGSASQVSQSSSPLRASTSPVAASPGKSQSGDTAHPPLASPIWPSQENGQKLQQFSQVQSDEVERLLAPETGDPGGMTSSKLEAQSSPADSGADLSIVKIEEAPETGGLDMYVDFPEERKSVVPHGEGDEHDKTYESEDPSIDWGGEEYSNEGSNLSADQSGLSWQGQGTSASINKGETTSVKDETQNSDSVEWKLQTLNKRQDDMEMITQRVEAKLDKLLKHRSREPQKTVRPSEPSVPADKTVKSSEPSVPSDKNRQDGDPFRDIPEEYRLSISEVMDIHGQSLGPGNFARKLCERIFPELYGPDNLRMKYSYFGGGQLNKLELDRTKKVYLRRYVIYLYPELQEMALWKDRIVSKINESLRRKTIKTKVFANTNKK